MRERSRSTLYSQPAVMAYKAEIAGCPGNRWTSTINYPGAKLGTRQVMWDTVTPKWRSLFRHKGTQKTFVVNPMTSISVSFTSQGTGASTELINPVSCGANPANLGRSVCAGDYMTAWFGNYVGAEPASHGWLLSEADVAELISEASTACRANVKAGSANLLVDLAESGQTYSMFATPFRSLASLLSAWNGAAGLSLKRRAQIVAARYKASGVTQSALTARGGVFVANLYLIYRYGISPLISSIKSIAETLSKKEYSPITTARGKSRAEMRSQKLITVLDGKFELTIAADYLHVVEVRAFSLDRYERDWQIELGLTPQNIPAALLDLTKFSFVVGWFVNIADYISALTPKFNLINLAEGYTVTDTYSCVYTIQKAVIAPAYVANYKWSEQPSGTSTFSRVTKRRVKGLLGPSLQVKGDFKFYRPTRVGDAIALAIQQINKFARTVK